MISTLRIWFYLILIIIFLLSFLSGCGGNGDDSTDGQKNNLPVLCPSPPGSDFYCGG